MPPTKRHGVAQILDAGGRLHASCPIEEDEFGSLNTPLLERWFSTNVRDVAGVEVSERDRQIARFESAVLSQKAKQVLAGLLHRDGDDYSEEDVIAPEAVWEELRRIFPRSLKPPLADEETVHPDDDGVYMQMME